LSKTSHGDAIEEEVGQNGISMSGTAESTTPVTFADDSIVADPQVVDAATADSAENHIDNPFPVISDPPNSKRRARDEVDEESPRSKQPKLGNNGLSRAEKVRSHHTLRKTFLKSVSAFTQVFCESLRLFSSNANA
jgi:hypothetical protein